MLPLLPVESKYPHPDWQAIHARKELEQLGNEALNAFWTEQGREWVHLLRRALGGNYVGYESANFWLISSQPAPTCQRLINWAEQVHLKVVRGLNLNTTGKLFGKCPILVVHDLDTYYDYITAYYEPGEHALSGGVYLNRGYGHFVFTFLNMNEAELVLAHELAHALVAHLPLPAWLNEGVAQLSEVVATGRDLVRYEEIRDHLDRYWNATTIQHLWTGRGFHLPNEGQLQSYHLAKVLTMKLTPDRRRFLAFLHEADSADAGAAALKKHYGTTLGALVSDYLGDGDWEPRLENSNGAPANEAASAGDILNRRGRLP